jgi:Family of unknown function (DUF5362)
MTKSKVIIIMSNLSSVINDNQANLKGAAFHYKFYGIISYVVAVIYCITIIYIPFGVLFFFIGSFLMKASTSVKNIIGVSELTQDEYNTNSMAAIVETKRFFKAMNIMFIVSMGILVLTLIIFGGFIFAAIQNQGSLSSGYNRNPSSIQNSYQPNPGNKTAEQMGMSQAEHDTLHDPKNIQATDYSTLDYGDNDKSLTAEEKAQVDAMTKGIIDKMNPENKALMNELMGNSEEGILNKLDK